MRLGKVVGRVVLHTSVPALAGGRFLLVNPFSRDHMQQGAAPPPGLSREPTLVVFDDLGAGLGDTVGFVEGREAAQPFQQRTPIDAYDAAIVDDVTYRPLP